MVTGTLRAAHYVVADWQVVAFGTGAADRDRAEAGVAAAYAAAGLTAPERYVWVPSPARGAAVAAVLAGHEEALRAAGLDDLVDRALADLQEGDSDSASTSPPNGTLDSSHTSALTETRGVGGTADSSGSRDFVRVSAGASVLTEVRTRPWEAERTAACSEQGPEQWPRVWAETGGLLWEQVQSLVTRVRGAIGAIASGSSAAERAGGDADSSVRDRAESLLRSATLDAVLGQHEAPWLALFESLGRLDGPLAGLAQVARSAGWWWPYERLVVLSERPSELYRDEPGRLHRGDGPAVAYPDGFALHAWRGMPIPPDFVESLSGLTPERISAEQNAELRRVMLEVFGYDRYLAETGARPLHRDETGVLWSIDLPGDEPVVMVEVVNSTPEPDGTHRTYYLRVPPSTRTARAGVAWTFGVDEADYHPEKQT